MHILNGENGEVIFDAFYFNQNPPAFNYDGKFVILGDYSGKAYLYEYDEDGDTYFENGALKLAVVDHQPGLLVLTFQPMAQR